MQKAARSLGFLAWSLFALASVCVAAEKPRIQVDDYIIHVAVTPQTHQLKAQARVKFTALDDVNIAVFELHNDLRPTRVIDQNGQSLTAERVSQDSTIRINLPSTLTKGSSDTLIFEYEGAIQSADDSPVPGLKLAYIGDPITYLLYAGRWFPMVSYGIDRFTSTISVSVPPGYTVIGSGKQSAAPGPEVEAGATTGKKSSQGALTRLATPAGGQTTTFTYTDHASFPGTIIIGKYVQTKSTEGGLDINVYTTPEHKQFAQNFADTATKEFFFFTTTYGPPFSQRLSVTELPNDTVPTAWAPEIAAVASHNFNQKGNYRLLANTIAHQWFGTMVSPATKNDWWLTDGGARYSEAQYVDHVAGEAGYQEVTKDMSVGALAYVSVPLADVSHLDTFSPEFQSLVTDKGGMILAMLQWVIGEEPYDKTMRTFMSQYAGKSASVSDFRKVAEQASGQQLNWFFTQWLNSTGAPEFKNKYTVYRTQKGFRVVGEISQDMDLFRMPVLLRIDTDGKTESKRIEVEGTNSAYAVETFGKPRRITIDPNNQVLQNSQELQVRTSIMRGQQDVEQGDLTEALKEYQKALDINRNSSLAHYRIAEVFFLQHNYQSAANAYREALNGDGEPRWTEVWSHIQLGMIFDLTGQRERATNEYRQALQTNDNTQNAMDVAREYLQKPYQPSDSQAPGL
jgi:Peptidase family M1 domain/TPR repeat